MKVVIDPTTGGEFAVYRSALSVRMDVNAPDGQLSCGRTTFLPQDNTGFRVVMEANNDCCDRYRR